jgi:ribosomal protein L7Ae-like RNA K-turn-binding protein
MARGVACLSYGLSLTYAHVRRIIVLAGDISPIDILTHIPLLAEEAACPYIVTL